jgi:hypothetical protein
MWLRLQRPQHRQVAELWPVARRPRPPEGVGSVGLVAALAEAVDDLVARIAFRR